MLEYRAISKMAVVAFIVMLIALTAYLWSLGLVWAFAAGLLAWRALRAIRLHPEELTGRLPAQVALLGSAIIFATAASWHVFVYYTEVPTGYERMSWEKLQPDEKESRVPVSKIAMDSEGKQIFIKGYVYPNDNKTNLKAFVLVRDRGTCCFGGQPDPTDMMYVVLEEPLRINYNLRQRKLGGKFSIDRNAGRSAGKIKSLGFYRLKADYLK